MAFKDPRFLAENISAPQRETRESALAKIKSFADEISQYDADDSRGYLNGEQADYIRNAVGQYGIKKSELQALHPHFFHPGHYSQFGLADEFDKAAQDQRQKDKKRFIFYNSHSGNYGIDGDPSKYIRFFNDYNSANDYLTQTEANEEKRRQALLERYYAGEGDLEQLHNDILNEYNGNYKAAFEWLYKNARR